MRQHQVVQDQDHEPSKESPLQLNMGVRQAPDSTVYSSLTCTWSHVWPSRPR